VFRATRLDVEDEKFRASCICLNCSNCLRRSATANSLAIGSPCSLTENSLYIVSPLLRVLATRTRGWPSLPSLQKTPDMPVLLLRLITSALVTTLVDQRSGDTGAKMSA
jgi:hypothetical protein